MSSARLHVAIVDDEESVRVAVGRVLRWAELDAETFASGDEFLTSRTGRIAWFWISTCRE